MLHRILQLLNAEDIDVQVMSALLEVSVKNIDQILRTFFS